MLKTLAAQIKEYRAASIATPLFMILEVLMETVIPLLMASIVDKGIANGDLNHVYRIGAIMLFCAAVGLFGGLMGAKYGAKASTGLAKNLRWAMFENIQRFSFANIDKFSTVACFGLAGAASVMVGKRIGEGAEKEEVYQLGLCLLGVSLLLGTAVSIVLAILLPTLFIPILYPLFQLSPTATSAAITLCIGYLVSMPLRAFDITNIIGLMRAGGDTRMAAILDIFPVYLFSIPLAALFGLVLDAPLYLVCIATQFESFIKAPVSVIRLRSRKWINDVTTRRD
jgi:ABC-type multidrug transport system fused ATPase/permease subunit